MDVERALAAKAVEVIRDSIDPLSIAEVAARLRCSPRTAGIAVTCAVAQGELVTIGGRWGLPTPGPSFEDLALANGAA